ncbi:MAG TPA: hypothetical protein PKL57_02980 [Candidatus Wallbacteria bacterium]|nr:hypothetical protein [Candidatus Wallbacteria bacterium]
MKRSNLLAIVMAFAMLLAFGYGISPAQDVSGQPGPNEEIQGGGPGQQIQDGGENRNLPPGKNHGRGDRMRPPMPIVLYIGYAVKAENEFEMASVQIFPDAGVEQGSKIKKPAGTIEIGKQKYFIVEAKIETQEASLQLFPEEAKKSGKKPPMVVKSCSAKISSTYFERPDAPPAPGQGDKMKIAEGTANIVGDINISSVEKEAGNRKLLMVSGTVNTGEKYSLYLEPRIIPPAMKGGRPGSGGPGPGGPKPGNGPDGAENGSQNDQPAGE